MLKKYFFIIIICLIVSTTSFAQLDSISTLEDFLELVSDDTIIDQDDSQILDLIELLLLYPVNINEATLQDILIIPFIDATTAESIIDYRNRNGTFFSKNELYQIERLYPEIVTILKPLISIDNNRPKGIFVADPSTLSSTDNQKNQTKNSYRLSFRSRVITDLQNRQGFTNQSYQGSKLKSYTRLRGDIKNNYGFSALIEKDAGENSFTDFYSANIFVKNVLLFDNIIIGDYLTTFGQGLVLWSPYAFSKGSDATATVIRKTRPFLPYSSSEENQFFRGIAISSTFEGVGLSGFLSINESDASLINERNQISSLPLSGFHRTSSELENKDVLKNSTFGFKLNVNPLDFLNISFLHMRTRFNKTLVSDNKFALKGNSFEYTSAAYDMIYNRLRLAGEIAYNGKSVASLNSLSLQLIKSLKAIILIRSYPRNFTNLYGNGFGESSRTQNEFGIYTGFKLRTSVGSFNIYYDQFKFPFATNDIALPSTGNEIMINYSNRISSGFYVNIKYKNEIKEIDEIIENIQQISDRRLQNYRLDFTINVNKDFRLKSRMEYTNFSVEAINYIEEGYLFYQDARLNLTNEFRIYGRIILFQSDSFNSRLYEFENDLTGVLSNPALFGEGIKWYVLINYSLLDNLKISMKYSELHKPNEIYLGSGLNKINNNTDNRLSLQIDYRL